MPESVMTKSMRLISVVQSLIGPGKPSNFTHVLLRMPWLATLRPPAPRLLGPAE